MKIKRIINFALIAIGLILASMVLKKSPAKRIMRDQQLLIRMERALKKLDLSVPQVPLTIHTDQGSPYAISGTREFALQKTESLMRDHKISLSEIEEIVLALENEALLVRAHNYHQKSTHLYALIGSTPITLRNERGELLPLSYCITREGAVMQSIIKEAQEIIAATINKSLKAVPHYRYDPAKSRAMDLDLALENVLNDKHVIADAERYQRCYASAQENPRVLPAHIELRDQMVLSDGEPFSLEEALVLFKKAGLPQE